MKLLISGSSGLVGAALLPSLRIQGHDTARLVRRPVTDHDAVSWTPETGAITNGTLEGYDGVVHLAGESIVGRWTARKKTAIRDSRVHDTRKLCEALAALSQPPKVLVCASAIGYYGDRGDEVLREDSAPGTGFLPEVCVAWEAACAPARATGIRVVNLRIGIVLSPRGGALARMLWPFRCGLGGVMGTGRQYWSWVSLGDVLGAVQYALVTETLHGPVNAVAPNATTNAELTRVLGRVLQRPTILPVPAWSARLLLGEMADALLLSSVRVEPSRLLQSGYTFIAPALEDALQQLLGSS